uniref:SIX1_SD domain-containing protein n=1 Tax=Macrostomum lignano TaxID=282301 RepID=A0A1I8FJT8_9PLAT
VPSFISKQPNSLPAKFGIRIHPRAQGGVRCEVLLQGGNVERLARFLWSLPKCELLKRNRKPPQWLFIAANFKELYRLVESSQFCMHAEITLECSDLWLRARYTGRPSATRRPLGAVGKYRVRKKFPLRAHKSGTGEETSYCFKERSRNALRDCKRTWPRQPADHHTGVELVQESQASETEQPPPAAAAGIGAAGVAIAELETDSARGLTNTADDLCQEEEGPVRMTRAMLELL